MLDRPDRERIRPTLAGRARLLAAIEMVGSPHVVDAGTLGEYAVLLAERGRAEADGRLPEVAEHLAEGCASCNDDLRELSMLAGDAEGPQPAAPGPVSLPALASPHALPPRAPSAGDSGIYVAGLPDPRAAEAAEAARRQRLRRLQTWLLVAAAASILLIGLSLVALAYTASQQAGPPRLGLTPQPAASPAVTGPGREAPTGTACPPSHPIKGNRSSMIYHRPGAEFYEQTRPEDCFASPADAEAAGYRGSLR